MGHNERTALPGRRQAAQGILLRPFAAGAERSSEPVSPGAKPKSIAESGVINLPLYKVLLHNDDVNTGDHVVRSLIRVFSFARERAIQIMIEANDNGIALCTVEPLEQAELHRDQLQSYSLTATIEPE